MSTLKGNARFDSVFSSNDYQIQDGPFKILLKKNITNDEISKLINLSENFLVKQKIKDFVKAKIKNHINNLKRKLESGSNATQSNQ